MVLTLLVTGCDAWLGKNGIGIDILKADPPTKEALADTK